MHDASSQSSSSTGGKKDSIGPLKQMRKGTKSCQECKTPRVISVVSNPLFLLYLISG